MNASVFKKGFALAGGIISAVFTVVPEDVFKLGFIPCNWSDSTVVLVNRLILCVAVILLACAGYCLFLRFRKSVTISDRTFLIKVEYNDLFTINKGKKVINFDECFSTKVGDNPEDIKPESVCGQYLAKYPIDDMQRLIDGSGIKSTGLSQYNKKAKYAPGTVIKRDDFLLMAFAKLDKKGLGYLDYEEYLDCLNRLWAEIDRYHGTDDVYLPILGSKITRIEKELTQQELLDIMIASYRLSPKKMKKPNTLHIVYKECEGFSLNDIYGVE